MTNHLFWVMIPSKGQKETLGTSFCLRTRARKKLADSKRKISAVEAAESTRKQEAQRIRSNVSGDACGVWFGTSGDPMANAPTGVWIISGVKQSLITWYKMFCKHTRLCVCDEQMSKTLASSLPQINEKQTEGF